MRDFPGYCVIAVGGLNSLRFPIISFLHDRLKQPSFFPAIRLQICETEQSAKLLFGAENLSLIPFIAVLNADLPIATLNEFVKYILEKVPNCDIVIDGFDKANYSKMEDRNFIAHNETKVLPIQKVLEALFYLKMTSPQQQAINRYYAQALLCGFADVSLVGGADYSPITMLREMMIGSPEGEKFLSHLMEIEKNENPSKFTRKDAQDMFDQALKKL